VCGAYYNFTRMPVITPLERAPNLQPTHIILTPLSTLSSSPPPSLLSGFTSRPAHQAAPPRSPMGRGWAIMQPTCLFLFVLVLSLSQLGTPTQHAQSSRPWLDVSETHCAPAGMCRLVFCSVTFGTDNRDTPFFPAGTPQPSTQGISKH
jgi:hypothetical protein